MRVKKENDDDVKRKLFVGGLAWKTTQDSLKSYFSRYGEVIDSVIVTDNESGRSRGFGFVTFSDPSIVELVLQKGPHQLDGRIIQPKPRDQRNPQKPKRSGCVPKIFLGGLPNNVTEADLRSFFQRFGKVEEVIIVYDQEKKKSRGFGFLSFEDEDAVDRCIAEHFVNINGKQVEVKRDQPRDSSNKKKDDHHDQRSPSQQGPPMGMEGDIGSRGKPNGQTKDTAMGVPTGPTKNIGSNMNSHPAAAKQAHASQAPKTDCNKEEAELCAEYARRCVREKKLDEARKYFEKAQQLHPNIVIGDYLEQIKSDKGSECGERKNENVWKYDAAEDWDKDEAEHCIELAECCIRENHIEKAKKYLEKAQRLYPKIVIEGLLEKLASMSNENRDNVNKTEVPKKNTGEADNHRIEEANRCMKLAEECMRENKLEEAEKYLTKSRELHKTWKSLKLSKKLIQMSKNSTRNKSTGGDRKYPTKGDTADSNVKGNKDMAEQCIRLAERYIREKKFGSAKRQLKKAQWLHSTKKAEELLEKVASSSAKNTNRDTPESDVRDPYSGIGASANEDQAERCREIAERYMREEKFDEAKRFLEKAQHLHPTDKVKELLREVASMSAKKTNFNTSGSETRDPYSGVGGGANEDQAERCRQLAERCIQDGKFDEAKKYLEKAQRLHHTQEAEELLEEVASISEEKNNRSTPESETRDPYSGVGASVNEDQAERCRILAEGCIREEKFDEAKKYLEKAQRLFPTREAEELLKKVASMSAKKTNRSNSESDTRNPYGGVGGFANKDQAERCLDLAEKFMREKKFGDAKKYLEKAQKLYPSEKAAELLRKVTLMSNQNADAPKASSRSRQTNGPRVEPTITYTHEQLALVTRINRCSDKYEILGISRYASITEIRQAYKKLALLLHPDKNKAPGATDAFRAMSNAATYLSNLRTNEKTRGSSHNYSNQTNKENRGFSHNTDFKSNAKDKESNHDRDSKSNTKDTGFSYKYENFRAYHENFNNNSDNRSNAKGAGFNYDHRYNGSTKSEGFNYNSDFKNSAKDGGFNYNHGYNSSTKNQGFNFNSDFKSSAKDGGFNYNHGYNSSTKNQGFNFNSDFKSSAKDTGFNYNHGCNNSPKNDKFNHSSDFKSNAKDRGFNYNHGHNNSTENKGFNHNSNSKSNAKDKEFHFDFKGSTKDPGTNYNYTYKNGADDRGSQPNHNSTNDGKDKGPNQNDFKCTVQ